MDIGRSLSTEKDIHVYECSNINYIQYDAVDTVNWCTRQLLPHPYQLRHTGDFHKLPT